jgi:hypothetical protein
VLTPEKALSILRAQRCWCAHETYTDENGAAVLLLVKPRTLRGWRKQGKGPSWLQTGRVLYEVAALVDWLNSTGAAQKQRTASGA